MSILPKPKRWALLPLALLLACTDARPPATPVVAAALPVADRPAVVTAPTVQASPVAAPAALAESPHEHEDFGAIEQLAGAPAAVPFLAAIDEAQANLHPPLKLQPPLKVAAILPSLRLPLLLPSSDARLQAAQVSAEADWYALSWHEAGATVLVQGTREGFESPDVPADFPTPTWDKPLIVRNELIVDATFVRAGASYLVSVECAQPASDVRCTQDAFVLDLVASLRRAEVRP